MRCRVPDSSRPRPVYRRARDRRRRSIAPTNTRRRSPQGRARTTNDESSQHSFVEIENSAREVEAQHVARALGQSQRPHFAVQLFERMADRERLAADELNRAVDDIAERLCCEDLAGDTFVDDVL